MCDYWGDNERKSDPTVWAQIEQLEFALTDRFPYKLLARNLQVIARTVCNHAPARRTQLMTQLPYLNPSLPLDPAPTTSSRA